VRETAQIIKIAENVGGNSDMVDDETSDSGEYSNYLDENSDPGKCSGHSDNDSNSKIEDNIPEPRDWEGTQMYPQLRHDRGYPYMPFLEPLPIPMNTVPAWVGMQCLSQVPTGYCGYSWVSTQKYFNNIITL
jgi:hypothetical protein